MTKDIGRMAKMEKGITDMIEEMKQRIEDDKYEHTLDAYGVAAGLETMIKTLEKLIEES